MMKVFFYSCFLWLVFQGQSFCQTSVASPNSLYVAFAEAYSTLDVNGITRLYADDAVIINLYDGQPPGSFNGKQAITAFYLQYFQTMASQKQKMRLCFKVISREATDQYLADSGYFLLEVISEGKVVQKLYGKFGTRLVNDGSGWKFTIDAATTATESEFVTPNVPIISSP